MKVSTIVNLRYRFRKNKLIRKIVHYLLSKKGIDLPASVKLGKNVVFPHNAFGAVIHPKTTIKDNVKIYQGVTIGRADIYNDVDEASFGGIIIEKDAVLCAGAKILNQGGQTLVVGQGTVIGANAVLTKNTGENEIWAGIPAKKISLRDKNNENSPKNH